MPRGGVNPQDAGTSKAHVSCRAEPLPSHLHKLSVKYTCLAKALSLVVSLTSSKPSLGTSHLLTERIFRKVLDNPDFVERNIIAREIDKVIQALTATHFSRQDFLKPLDRFYGAIEAAAAAIDDYAQKQTFLNTVYEKFFQGFSVQVADGRIRSF